MTQPAHASRRWGQHFLSDPAILDRIAIAAGPVAGEMVIEVGPGPGGLTAALLRAGADPLIGVEIDARFASALAQWPEARNGRLRVLHADAAQIDWHSFAREHGIAHARIVANLPYNVAARLIVDWVRIDGWRREMVIMVQKEVGQRLCAAPGSGAYGRLSVLVQAATTARIALTLPPGAFHPPPKVESALVVLTPLPPGQRFDDWSALAALTAAAFGQRRKMLRASLKNAFRGRDAITCLRAAGIDPQRRPEMLTQAEFRVLAGVFAACDPGDRTTPDVNRAVHVWCHRKPDP